MALVESTMLPLGTVAPAFELIDTISDAVLSLDELKSGKATVIMFICNHCPYVIHVNEGLVALANDYIPKGVSFIAISANDAEVYHVDSPDNMKAHAADEGYPFPYLYDETQSVAKKYDAACTPDFYIFDGDMRLAYRGRLDDSRPNSGIPVTGRDMRNAIDSIIAKNTISVNQIPSMGCNIKWKQ